MSNPLIFNKINNNRYFILSIIDAKHDFYGCARNKKKIQETDDLNYFLDSNISSDLVNDILLNTRFLSSKKDIKLKKMIKK